MTHHTHDCPHDDALRVLFERPGGADEALLGHLVDCLHCRERLALQQLMANRAQATPVPRPARLWAWQPALAASLSLALAAGWWLRPAPPVEQWRADPTERPLAALAAVGDAPHARDQPIELRWNPQPQSRGYRLVCYRASSPEWLRREFAQPQATLKPSELAHAPADGVCRLDAELADGGWVAGDEQALALKP